MEFGLKNLTDWVVLRFDWAMLGGAAFFSGVLLRWAGIKFREYIVKMVQKVDKEIEKIDNEELEIASRQVVRYIAQKMPDADNSIKLQAAILRIKQIVPNVVISDDKIETFIEAAYLDFKRELSKI